MLFLYYNIIIKYFNYNLYEILINIVNQYLLKKFQFSFIRCIKSLSYFSNKKYMFYSFKIKIKKQKIKKYFFKKYFNLF